MTEAQQSIGMKLLTNEHLIDEIASDYDELGYVQERKNKVLMYLVMTSRLMDNPLHAMVVSRSGAGKSRLAEVTTELCPPEDAEIVSDLSANALYYVRPYGRWMNMQNAMASAGSTAYPEVEMP